MKRKRKQHLRFSGLLLFSVLVILTALLSVGSRAEENLLINASFEESDEKGLPEGWKADAYVMDNSDMTLHEETVWLRGLVQGKFGILE
jgi:hypothetical protein